MSEPQKTPTLFEWVGDIQLRSDPKFRSTFVGYLEWGTRIAVINSHLTENPLNTEEPMPTWGWGETKEPYLD